MRIQASGTIEATSWDEDVYSDTGKKLARVVAGNRYSGDVEGSATLSYLLTYLDERSGTGIGYEQVTGTVGGRSGGFVLEHRGSFTGERVEIELGVVAGSGTDDFAGISGSGRFTATYDGNPALYALELDLS